VSRFETFACQAVTCAAVPNTLGPWSALARLSDDDWALILCRCSLGNVGGKRRTALCCEDEARSALSLSFGLLRDRTTPPADEVSGRGLASVCVSLGPSWNAQGERKPNNNLRHHSTCPTTPPAKLQCSCLDNSYPAARAGVSSQPGGGRRLGLIPCAISQVLYIRVCYQISPGRGPSRGFYTLECELRRPISGPSAYPGSRKIRCCEFLLNSFPLSLGDVRDLPPHQLANLMSPVSGGACTCLFLFPPTTNTSLACPPGRGELLPLCVADNSARMFSPPIEHIVLELVDRWRRP
jgi:hypothetical protein